MVKSNKSDAVGALEQPEIIISIELIDSYKELSEKCDVILEKITERKTKNRKNKK